MDAFPMISESVKETLHRWAIPEYFNGEIVLCLLADKEPADARQLWYRFEEAVSQGYFPFIRRTGLDRYVFEAGTRERLLEYWRVGEHKKEFQQLNRALHEYFEARLKAEFHKQSPAPVLFSLLRQSLYHLIAADEEEGFRKFERWFSHYEQAGQALVCQELLNVLEQRMPDLSPRRQLWVALYRARLLALCERLGIAEGASPQAALEDILQKYSQLRKTEPFADPLLEGWVWNTLGLVAFQQESHKTAADHFRKAVDVLNEGALIQEAITVSVNLGLALRIAGQSEEALQVCEHALERARIGGVSDTHLLAALWLNLGMIYGDLAQAERPFYGPDSAQRARNYFTRAALTYSSLGDRHREGLALALYGRWLLLYGEAEEAIVYLEKALEILKSVNAPECKPVEEWLEICRRLQRQQESPVRMPTYPKSESELLQRFLQEVSYSPFDYTVPPVEESLLHIQDIKHESISDLRETFVSEFFRNPGHQETRIDSSEFLELGQRAYRNGDLTRAIGWFQDAVAQARRELRADIELVALDWLSLSLVMTGSPDATHSIAELMTRARRLRYEK